MNATSATQELQTVISEPAELTDLAEFADLANPIPESQPPSPHSPLAPVIARARRIISETLEPEKQEALRRLIARLGEMKAGNPVEVSTGANTLLPAGWQLDHLMACVERFTYCHLEILQFLNDVRGWLLSVGFNFQIRGEEAFLRKPFSQFFHLVAGWQLLAGVPVEFFQIVVNDLRAAGLIVAGDFAASQDAEGLTERKTTDLGRLLVELAMPELTPLAIAPPRKLTSGELWERDRAGRQRVNEAVQQQERERRERELSQGQATEQQQSDEQAKRDAARAEGLKDGFAAIERQFPTYKFDEPEEEPEAVATVATADDGELE